MKRFKVILLLLFIGDCTGEHIFIVKLESGDEISFVNGCLGLRRPYFPILPLMLLLSQNPGQ